jgi:small-conductance mechanosensitive channel
MQELTAGLIRGGLILAATVLALAAVQLIARRSVRSVQSMQRVDEPRRQQLVTIAQTVKWTVNVVIVGAAVLTLLSTFGMDITPLLASAGVAGLAVSLGAQTLIKDFIGGVLILLENLYVVGDTIQVGNVTGQVEQITLRTTHVRELDGDLFIVPNGEVRILANQTKEWSRAMVEVGVAYEEDLDRALSVLRESATAFVQDTAIASNVLEAPQVMGPVSLGDWAATMRVMVKTKPGKQWEVAREWRKFILAACDREGIALPYPRQEIWVRGASGKLETASQTTEG